MIYMIYVHTPLIEAEGQVWEQAELRKDFFRPVSRFSTQKCPNYIFELCHKSTVLQPFYA